MGRTLERFGPSLWAAPALARLNVEIGVAVFLDDVVLDDAVLGIRTLLANEV